MACAGKAPHPIEIPEEGIVTCLKDEQPEKALSLITFTEEGISISVISEQSLKALQPIETTEAGMVILFKEEHPEKVAKFI